MPFSTLLIPRRAVFFYIFYFCSDDGNFLVRLTEGKRPTKKGNFHILIHLKCSKREREGEKDSKVKIEIVKRATRNKFQRNPIQTYWQQSIQFSINRLADDLARLVWLLFRGILETYIYTYIL